jgi:hypothetical protein
VNPVPPLRRLLLQDESDFVDFKRSSLWIVKEHGFIDHGSFI